MKAFILAAGVSRRLYPHTYDLPKCLLDVGGKPIINYQLEAIEEIAQVDDQLEAKKRGFPRHDHEPFMDGRTC